MHFLYKTIDFYKMYYKFHTLVNKASTYLFFFYKAILHTWVFLLKDELKAENLVSNSGTYLFKNTNASGNELIKQTFNKI